MKVTLINPPVRENQYPDQFPIGLAYIASVLLKAGHSVSVVDINARRYRKEEVQKMIENFDADVVGIGGMITTYSYVKWLVSEIRRMKPNIKIVVGGGVCSAIPKQFMEWTQTDIIVVGEGELTVVDLLDNLENLESVRGIWYRDKNGIHANPPRELIKDLDSIPFPAWELFPMDVYLKNPTRGYMEKKMNVLAGRGCPYRCTFCWHNFGDGNRTRSAENVVEEIKQLQSKYGVNIIIFEDELFTANKSFVMDFCRKIKEQKIKLKWDCQSRVNIIEKDILHVMKDAGCISVGFGVESGSQTMLDAMKKGTTVEQGKNAIRMMKEAGIRFHVTFMIGTPGETKETIWETVSFCKELNIPHRIELFFATPFPSTPLYEYAKNKGLIKDEEKFISKLGDTVNFLINLTDMSDEELVALRNKAQKEAQPSFFTRAMFYRKHFGVVYLLRAGIKKIHIGHVKFKK